MVHSWQTLMGFDLTHTSVFVMTLLSACHFPLPAMTSGRHTIWHADSLLICDIIKHGPLVLL